jgi:glyoxylase-like metal-dependent hydrolase (beta-lactamase superfamily II)
MNIFKLEPQISLIDLNPPIAGFEGFLSCYVIKSQKTALLDVGPSSSLPNLFSALAALDIRSEAIDYLLCTHVHLDHSGGLGGAFKKIPGATAIAHEKGIPHLVSPSRLWKGSLQVLGALAEKYGEPEPSPQNKLISAQEGMVVDLGDIRLEIILTPGHASHHISFFERKTRRLFVGEAAGANLLNLGGMRPATPNPFDFQQTLDSINKLISLNPDKIYFAHFGRFENAVSLLNQSKKQLKLWGEVVAGHLNDNSDWPVIFNEIVNQSPPLGKILELPDDVKNNLYSFICNNIIGFREYFLKEGTQILNNLED